MRCSVVLPYHAATWVMHAVTGVLLLGTQQWFVGVEASRVLVAIPHFILAPNSHLFMLNRIIQELADRGHSVGVSGTANPDS